jgi:hypothetical protein
LRKQINQYGIPKPQTQLSESSGEIKAALPQLPNGLYLPDDCSDRHSLQESLGYLELDTNVLLLKIPLLKTERAIWEIPNRPFCF